MSSRARVGFGFDAHRFARGRALVLGGVRLRHGKGLAGHSDADVLSHAVADALLGAARMGDLGSWFPDSDPRGRGASSQSFLSTIARALKKANVRILNVDCVVVGEEPRIAPHRERMATTLAASLGLRVTAVQVKGKSTEGMGFAGRREGLAAYAVALVEGGRKAGR